MINNKTLEGYLEMFNKIKAIISIENTKELKLQSYSTDFEKALIIALGLIFKGIRQIGCYFHYCKNIRKNALKYKIITSKKSKNNDFLNEIYSLPFKYKGDKSNIDNILKQFCSDDNKRFIDYFINQWIPYFLNNMLDYSNINKSVRSNSYIENYHRKIKLKLSKFLYGKNKSLITWPLLLYFIINEEQEYRNEIYDNEANLEEKFSQNYKTYIEENNFSKIKKELLHYSEKKVYFLNWKNNSCRYDVFFFLFTYIILEDIKNIDKFENDNINILKNISTELLMAHDRILEDGIWDLLNNYKTQFFDLTTSKEKYKEFNSFLQCINLLNNDPIFCIKYSTIEGCSICKNQIIKENYFQPFIDLNEEDLKNNIDLNVKLNNILKNISTTCLIYGYDKEGKIINENTYYKIITSRSNPNYLFICFEFIDINSGNYIDLLDQEIKNYDNRIKYNNEIISYIQKNKKINNDEYILVGVVTTPSNDHYTGIIVNMLYNISNLLQNHSYFYDSKSYNHRIIEVENLDLCLNSNNPYIALYKKITK